MSESSSLIFLKTRNELPTDKHMQSKLYWENSLDESENMNSRQCVSRNTIPTLAKELTGSAKYDEMGYHIFTKIFKIRYLSACSVWMWDENIIWERKYKDNLF